MAKGLFWASLAAVAYTYLGYPLLLAILRPVARRPVRKGAIEPTVSIVVPAHDEAGVIGEKIDNALSLDYPPEKLDVIVVSDGSRDGTAEAARARAKAHQAGARVMVIEHADNHGKTAALNAGVSQSTADVVVLTDAAAMFAPDAVRALMRNYADEEVGAAGGIYRVASPDTAVTGAQEDWYWRYETRLKQSEGDISSVLGTHGQISSVRRALYPNPPESTVNDDYVIPISVLERDYRVAYEPAAVAYEPAHEMSGFGRRVRIARGNVQRLGDVRLFLRPSRAWLLLFFISHKVLRVISPFALLAMAVATVLLWREPLYAALASVQLAFYAAALLGGRPWFRPKLLRLPHYFCLINLAIVVAVAQELAGRERVSWQ
jgi:cellulose synthase/poly-beta-1,6-N-acetylglucosamine synthase-like glycosyltransferase